MKQAHEIQQQSAEPVNEADDRVKDLVPRAGQSVGQEFGDASRTTRTPHSLATTADKFSRTDRRLMTNLTTPETPREHDRNTHQPKARSQQSQNESASGRNANQNEDSSQIRVLRWIKRLLGKIIGPERFQKAWAALASCLPHWKRFPPHDNQKDLQSSSSESGDDAVMNGTLEDSGDSVGHQAEENSTTDQEIEPPDSSDMDSQAQGAVNCMTNSMSEEEDQSCENLSDSTPDEGHTHDPDEPIDSYQDDHPVSESISDLQFNIKIVILNGSKKKIRGCKLDTGSKFDIISKRVVDACKLEVVEYHGPKCVPFGGRKVRKLKPLGKTSVDWTVFGKPRTYTTEFVILRTEETEDFDTLLGEQTIKDVGFFARNHKVYILGNDEEV